MIGELSLRRGRRRRNLKSCGGFSTQDRYHQKVSVSNASRRGHTVPEALTHQDLRPYPGESPHLYSPDETPPGQDTQPNARHTGPGSLGRAPVTNGAVQDQTCTSPASQHIRGKLQYTSCVYFMSLLQSRAGPPHSGGLIRTSPG